jgi:flavorubredoxin
MKAIIIYWSGTGNTKKVAETIDKTLKASGVDSVLKAVKEAADEDLFDYDLVFVGSPSFMWQPPEPMLQYIKDKMNHYRERDYVKLSSPKVPGKYGVVFATFSGPHTGINEAIPVGKYIGQFLEHLGFDIVDEWYYVGEFHSSEENSTKGRLGDIRGRPNQQDLDKLARDVKGVLKAIAG